MSDRELLHDVSDQCISAVSRRESQRRLEYVAMIDSLRAAQDVIAGSAPPPEVSGEVTGLLAQLSNMLVPHLVGEGDQLFNRIPEVAGHAQTLTPRIVVDESGPECFRGRVTFTRFHLGGGDAAHGGAIALLFDTVLGGLANSGGRPRARTAKLTTDYRHITPMYTELDVSADVVSVQGRKRHLVGTLGFRDTVCAEVRGLFIELLPGQQ